MNIFKPTYWALLLFFTTTACKNKFFLTMNQAEIDTHFSNKKYKPVFGIATTSYGKIYYASIGDTSKPLLVFVHGAPGAWYGNKTLYSDSTILQNYCILTYDRLGFGKSEPWLPISNTTDQAKSINELLLQLPFGKKSITLLGRSYGTTIAARYAMLYPSNVNKLILVASCVAPNYEKYFWFSYFAKWAVANNLLNNDLQSTTIEKFRHNKQLKLIEKDWNLITVPTYILHGTNDWIAYTHNALYAFNALSNANATLYLIDKAGHNLIQTHPELVKEIILKKE